MEALLQSPDPRHHQTANQITILTRNGAMVDLELYGGRRGYVFHLAARAMGALGAYRRLGALDWGTVTRLVFVCKGNICRSPYAAARAQQLAVEATSFGLDAIEGAP